MNTKKTTWRFWLSLVILLVLVPLTVLVFSRFDRKYYLAGLAIIVLTTAAFFLHFESRKPQARELVILAVLCALAVASRAAFAAVPHFKPMLAISRASPSGRRRVFCAGPSAALPATLFSARDPGPRGKCLPTASADCWRGCLPCGAF